MLFSNKTRRQRPQVNAGSMADIAFLLLVFFLVVTTISVDSGIKVKLPPWSDDSLSMIIASRNVFSVKINTNDELLVEGELLNVGMLKERTKAFIANPNQEVDLAKSPKQAIISLQNDRGTSYETYVSVYNELKAAYNELWEEEAQKRYESSYKKLDNSLQKEIRKEIPLVISEAEQTAYGG